MMSLRLTFLRPLLVFVCKVKFESGGGFSVLRDARVGLNIGLVSSIIPILGGSDRLSASFSCERLRRLIAGLLAN